MTGKCRAKQRYGVYFLKRFHGASKLGLLYYKTHVAIFQTPSDFVVVPQTNNLSFTLLLPQITVTHERFFSWVIRAHDLIDARQT